MRKTITLALAVGALMALGLPAPASAGWGHNEAELKASPTIGMTGTIKLTTESGGVVECQVTYSVKLEPTSKGQVEALGIDGGTTTEKCATGGNLKTCQVHQFEPTGLPWALSVSAQGAISVTTGEIHVSITGASCPIAKFSTTAGKLFLGTTAAHKLGSIAPWADLQADVFGGGKMQVSVSGSLAVESPNFDTYEVLFPKTVWTHQHVNLLEPVNVGLTGPIRFTTATGHVECEVTYGLKLEPQSTGWTETFGVDGGTATEKCKGAGSLVGCQVHGVTPTGLPWSVHAGGTPSVSITVGQIDMTVEGIFCPYKTIAITPHTLTAVPEGDPRTLGKLLLAGNVQEDFNTGGSASATVAGTLSFEAPNSGTYGIG